MKCKATSSREECKATSSRRLDPEEAWHCYRVVIADFAAVPPPSLPYKVDTSRPFP